MGQWVEASGTFPANAASSSNLPRLRFSGVGKVVHASARLSSLGPPVLAELRIRSAKSGLAHTISPAKVLQSGIHGDNSWDGEMPVELNDELVVNVLNPSTATVDVVILYKMWQE